MTAATALISGNEPLPQLVERAVSEALDGLNGEHANGVLLFLTPEFTRQAASVVLSAARAARCMQVFGSICAGVCTEAGWVLDRPGVAAMALGGNITLSGLETGRNAEILCCTSNPFPSEWQNSHRYGLHFHGTAGDSAVWQQGRPNELGCVETHIAGARLDLLLSNGTHDLGQLQMVTDIRGYDLLTIDGMPAADALTPLLPADWQARQPLPIHLINAIIPATAAAPAEIASVLSVNADRSITLSSSLQPGQRLTWAVRQPLSAEAEMCATLGELGPIAPDFGLFFSCIGRGPYFYGGEDRDLAAITERFPEMPLIGGYGTGQIAFSRNHSRQLQNAVVTALFTETHDAV